MGWYSSNDESKARVLENAYNKYEVEGRAKSSEVSDEQSNRQRARSHESNQAIKVDNDSRIKQAIGEIGLTNKRAVARLAGVNHKKVYRYLKENDY